MPPLHAGGIVVIGKNRQRTSSVKLLALSRSLSLCPAPAPNFRYPSPSAPRPSEQIGARQIRISKRDPVVRGSWYQVQPKPVPDMPPWSDHSAPPSQWVAWCQKHCQMWFTSVWYGRRSLCSLVAASLWSDHDGAGRLAAARPHGRHGGRRAAINAKKLAAVTLALEGGAPPGESIQDPGGRGRIVPATLATMGERSSAGRTARIVTRLPPTTAAATNSPAFRREAFVRPRQ